MTVDPVILEVDDDPVFLRRHVLPQEQREGVLKTINEMESVNVIFYASSSLWTTLTVMAMKTNRQRPRIYGDYRSIPNPRLRRCASATKEPVDFKRRLLGNRYFSKIDLADARP